MSTKRTSNKGDPKVRCAHMELTPTQELKPNPKNPNFHPTRQIELLIKIIDYQGWRNPVVVSRRSGYIVRGHARHEAALKAGWERVPVDFQDYFSEAQEYADLIADNQIAEMATMDWAALRDLAVDLKDDFDPELFAIPNITLDSSVGDPFNPEEEWEGMPEFYAEDKTAFRSVIVHIKNKEAFKKFQKVMGQKLTDKTKSIWFPKEEYKKVAHLAYVQE